MDIKKKFKVVCDVITMPFRAIGHDYKLGRNEAIESNKNSYLYQQPVWAGVKRVGPISIFLLADAAFYVTMTQVAGESPLMAAAVASIATLPIIAINAWTPLIRNQPRPNFKRFPLSRPTQSTSSTNQPELHTSRFQI